MIKKTYSDLLKHPKWQQKRLEILNRDSFTCKGCGETELTLHVHHFTYQKGQKPWEYDNSNFITLCENCHAEEELFVKFQHEGFVKLNRLTLFPITKMFHLMKVICYLHWHDKNGYEEVTDLIISKVSKSTERYAAFDEQIS